VSGRHHVGPFRRGALFLAGTALLLAAGTARALWLAWTCDDAWISFRYARNLVSGLGPVFNPGERVEGYTNPLWVLLTAPAFSFRIPPETWANALSISSFAGVVLLLAWRAWERSKTSGGARAPIPVAAALIALNPDMHVWATGGLETAFFSLLLVAGVVVLAGAGGKRIRPPAAGALFGLAALARPDGILPAGVAAAWLLLAGRERRIASAAAFTACVAAFVDPHVLWRHAYYGEWLPNTYFAKSAWLPWWGQGLRYLELFLRRNALLLLGLPLIAAAFFRSRASGDIRDAAARPISEALLLTGIAASYTLYVTRVGGDFMYARLLVPVMPFLALLLEVAVSQPGLPAAVRAGSVAAAVLLPLVVADPVPPELLVHGVANERAVYTGGGVRLADQVGLALQPLFAGLPVRVLAGGAEMRVAYRSEAAEIVEAHGLTDRWIARQPLRERGRVGHERFADLGYVVRTRRVHFMFHPPEADYPAFPDLFPSVTVKYGPAVLFMLSWDPPVMDELARRGARFRSFPEGLDRYLASIDALPEERVRRDYVRCRNFYFDHVSDPAREAPFKRRLGLP